MKTEREHFVNTHSVSVALLGVLVVLLVVALLGVLAVLLGVLIVLLIVLVGHEKLPPFVKNVIAVYP